MLKHFKTHNKLTKYSQSFHTLRTAINKLTKTLTLHAPKSFHQLSVPKLVKTCPSHYAISTCYRIQYSQLLIRSPMHTVPVHLPFYLFQILFEIITTIISRISTNTVTHIYLISLSTKHNISSMCPYKDTTNALKCWLCKCYHLVLTKILYIYQPIIVVMICNVVSCTVRVCN